MAKDLVRTRRYVRKFMLMKANIQAVSLKIQTLKSQNTMAQAMRGVTRAMATMNRQLNMPQIQKILQVRNYTSPHHTPHARDHDWLPDSSVLNVNYMQQLN